MKSNAEKISEDLRPYLSDYGPQAYDGYCDEPIYWGYKIIKHCGDEIWSKLSTLGTLECLQEDYGQSWILVTKSLTREEAEAKYGPIVNEEYGPRGGWKSVTFGTKKFISKSMKSD